jgi:DNA-binding MarR family transcriptional regulator
LTEAKAFRVDRHVGFMLRRAYQRAAANLSAIIAGHELTPVQFAALSRLLEADEPLSQNRLGRLIDMERGNTHLLVRKLLARKLIAKQPAARDRRLILLSLTDAGRRLIETLLARADEANARTLAPLSAPERRTLMELLARIAADARPGRGRDARSMTPE